MAPARAAVRLSTSSVLRNRQPGPRAERSGERHTNEDDNEAALVVDHVSDLGEQALDELARLGEPLAEERVRVDLDQLARRVPVPVTQSVEAVLTPVRTGGEGRAPV